MAKDQMTGAEIVLQALKDQGVTHIFGYPGGAVLPIYDVLFGQNDILHVLVRQEGGAVHAAEGYARSTGKVGVVLVTSGPGVTNSVTGLTDALMDSVPLVCITGQVPTHLIGNDAFQECDTTGITRPWRFTRPIIPVGAPGKRNSGGIPATSLVASRLTSNFSSPARNPRRCICRAASASINSLAAISASTWVFRAAMSTV